MISLVTLEAVKQGLHVEEDDWDELFENILIPAASKAVINYLKGNAEAVLGLDSGGQLPSGAEVPEEVQLATISLVGHFWREPDADTEKAWEQGYLPRPVTALLYPLRDPSLA